MRYQPLPIAAAYRRFLALSQKLKRMLLSGTFSALSQEKQQAFLRQIRQLFQKLRRVIPHRRLRHALAASALLLGLEHAQAQEFAAPVQNPFGLDLGQNENGFLPAPQLVDIDGDGDFDLFHRTGTNDLYGSNILLFQENIGTPQEPEYGEIVINPFGVGTLNEGTTLTFGDLDGDGDLDMLTGQYDAPSYGFYFTYYENIGTPTAPAFATPQTDPFGLSSPDDPDSTIPFLADMDNDGDLDLLVGTYSYTYSYPYGSTSGAIAYFPNIGTAQNPEFGEAQINPFGLQPPVDGYLFLPAVADFDNDGDPDIIAGGEYQYEGDFYQPILQYYENTGSPEQPFFASPQSNAFGLLSDNNSYFLLPTAADLDADGDIDLLTCGNAYDEAGGEYDKIIFEYFENTAVINTVDAPKTNAGFQLFPTLARAEVQWKVETSQSAGQLWISIFDLNGRQFRQEEVVGKAGTLSISDLPGGLYQVRLTDEQGQLLGVQRIVKP
jgi:hypothetical protein